MNDRIEDNAGAFHKAYLFPLMDLHRLLFIELNKLEDYNIFSLIDAYYQTSIIRAKMDIGNWSALNKGYKQLFNDINMSICDKTHIVVDDSSLRWMADIYTLLQWKYKLSSKEMNKIVNAQKLYELYNPLHETSEDKTCEKIYNNFIMRSRDGDKTI
jgi:uncharacterized protein YfkK (UPF0435 family)